MNKVHELKTQPKYFNQTLKGNKPFEIRINDRKYKVGDTIILKEWEGTSFSGRELHGKITYILKSFCGLTGGYVAFTLDIYKKIYN